jgi:phosphoribosyl 1,2-cyclic phosphodiesterase
MDATVTFFGVRGSIPTPGSTTVRVGGNTACVAVRFGDQLIVLDGGSGLRQLGASTSAPLEATLLFGHLHWDHIQGVPFFGPLFHPQTRLTLVGPEGLREALAAQMSGPSFPVRLDQVPAQLRFETLAPGARFGVGDVQVATAPLRHPGGGLAYRLERAGVAVAYVCDTEAPEHGPDAAHVALADGADLLVHDAQYLPEEYPAKVGWGHSTFATAAALARAAGARRLVLTHHDPTRDDLAVARLERRARRFFPETLAAREGLSLTVHAAAAAPGAAGPGPVAVAGNRGGA